MIGRLVVAAAIACASMWYEPLGSSDGTTLKGRTTQPPNDVTLWVTLGDSDILAEVDAYKFKEIRRIKVDPKPHGLTASADGSKVYLTSDRLGNLQVVDVGTGTITARLPLGKDPNQMTLTKDGRHAYVPMRGENRIDLVQLDPLKLVKSFPSDKGPHDAYTTADGSRVYVGAQFGRSIDVIEPATQTALPRIPTIEED